MLFLKNVKKQTQMAKTRKRFAIFWLVERQSAAKSKRKWRKREKGLLFSGSLNAKVLQKTNANGENEKRVCISPIDGFVGTPFHSKMSLQAEAICVLW